MSSWRSFRAAELDRRIYTAEAVGWTPQEWFADCQPGAPASLPARGMDGFAGRDAGAPGFAHAADSSIRCHNPAHRKALGRAIRHYRKKANLTQQRLGELADLNPKYIGEVERMEKTISVDALARIASALKVRLRDLVRDV